MVVIKDLEPQIDIKESEKMKDYQNLIAGILISIAIVIAAYIIAGAIETGCNYIGARIINLGDFIMSSFN